MTVGVAPGVPTLADLVRARTPRWRRPVTVAAVGLAAVAVAVLAGIAFGSVTIPVGDTVAILAHRLLGWPVAVTWPASSETIVLELRLPRVIMALLAGGGLAVAGATMQGVLRNPLADPYVLGTASGAALGAALAVLVPLQLGLLGLGFGQLLAFAGAVVAVALVWRLSRASRLGSLTGLLLTGYAVSSLLAAGLAMAMVLAGAQLRQIVFFLLGSLATATWPQVAVAAPLIVGGVAVLTWRARALDALMLGDETAAHLGVAVARERIILLGGAALVTAAAVAACGLIGFVGLVVPHMVRLVIGPAARPLLPLAAIFGAAFLALADLVARLPGELPVGIVTAVIGA
ncbi:MAG TPA: iron ABC transporter permease, partial [Candidatus Sulfotelmatobacter sp.]|nr:iron ABC transporter permease [Candidatus Sulfotelmatobacter sp.]